MAWFSATEPLLHDHVTLNAVSRADQWACVCGEDRLTWRALADRLHQAAEAYAALGLERGDRIAILMDNSIDMLVAMLGAVCGGYVVVPLNTSVSDDGIRTMLRDSAARTVVASGEHIARVDSMQLQDGSTHLLSVGDAGSHWHDFTTLLDAQPGDKPFAPVQPDADCNIIFSSGTTGHPKGIVHSHACRMAWARDLSLALRYRPGARTLATLGLYSNISWVMLLNTVLCGGTLFITRGFDASQCLSLIEDEQISHLSIVPVQLRSFLNDRDVGRYDLSSLESVMCCGAPLAPALKLDTLARLTPNLIELYGLTEGLITIQDLGDAESFPESVGRPAPGQQLKILRDDDTEAPVGDAGEIVGLGRLMMTGYLNRDDANAESTWTDADGRRWLRTGDIGRLDALGNLMIVDRKKDMIISGGQNVYPADIEAVMQQHSAVSEVAVIGVPSERWGETPLAIVVAHDPFDSDALVDWTNARVGRQQKISGVRKVDALPRNANGKVLKRRLRVDFANVLF